jgi:predicted dehydrogenase
MERHRVTIFGTAFGRTVHGPGFPRHPGFELVAIAGSDEARTARAASDLGVTTFGTDWRRILAESSPQLVSIATPVDLHHPMMLAAIERGCHVLCEKPTAMNRFQAAEMRDAAAARGVVAAINHEFRFFPARRLALERVRAGDIGTPRRGEILGRYALWAKPESRGMTWLSDARRGGGILGALGSHHTDLLRLFFGEPRVTWSSVRVDQPQRGPTADQPSAAFATADDACTVQYEFDGGATGLIDLRACAPYRWERFEIHGSDATLRWDETGYRLWRIVAGREPEELEIDERLRLAPREGDHALLAPFGALLDRLHRALNGDERMEPDFDDAVAVQSALDAVRSSGLSGTRVRIHIPIPSSEAIASNRA